ncbi:MAG TPA: SRPBCC family protein, partial [Acidimicrobiia bacterium]|nr:SRPBCC family protein [Acidimicrobiia bacterium]
MSVIDAVIEVDVPLRATYDQWTQFEEFPQFMEGVEAVRQIDDVTLHWVAEIGGQRREWDA